MRFFDTYALIEIIKGKESYSQFATAPIITTILNLAELYYFFIKETNKTRADAIINLIKPDLLEIDLETIKKAMEFRYDNIKRKMSMIDCIGYIVARKHHLLFLTGDDAFRTFDSVELVK